MFTRLRARRHGTPLPRLMLYAVLRALLVFVLKFLYRYRTFGARRIPTDGPLLLVANHQSFLDPPAIGAGVPRHLDYIAREGLFKNRAFGWLIATLNAIPIREDSGDAGAIKEVLKRLAEGRAVIIFPEGTRCETGAMEPFKRGVALLVKRSRCPVLPVAIEGAFDIWPRHRRRPSLTGHGLSVAYGDPIPYDELMKDGPDAAMTRLALQVEHMRLALRRDLRRRTRGEFPLKGAGDQDARPRLAAGGHT